MAFVASPLKTIKKKVPDVMACPYCRSYKIKYADGELRCQHCRASMLLRFLRYLRPLNQKRKRKYFKKSRPKKVVDV